MLYYITYNNVDINTVKFEFRILSSAIMMSGCLAVIK